MTDTQHFLNNNHAFKVCRGHQFLLQLQGVMSPTGHQMLTANHSVF